MTDSPDVDFSSAFTNTLPQILDALGISLVITTYQAGKVIFVSSRNGRINTHYRNFNVPMGLALDGNKLAIGTKTEVREYRNVAAAAARVEPLNTFDACYVPRASHTTGFVAGHEMAYANGELWWVNTRFSCLCTTAPDYSFVPRWKPEFISQYSPEDRCHLNGLGTRDDKIRYITALGETDTVGGWRANKVSGGYLFDVKENRTVTRGLCMPHSPRWYQDQLWFLESGKGALSTVNETTGVVSTVAELPGFTRGLDFYDRFAFIGLSQVRDSAAFSGLPITQKEDRACGLWVVDLQSRQTVAFLKFSGSVKELFAVQVLPGIRNPELLSQDDKMVEEAFVLPDEALEIVPEVLKK